MDPNVVLKKNVQYFHAILAQHWLTPMIEWENYYCHFTPAFLICLTGSFLLKIMKIKTGYWCLQLYRNSPVLIFEMNSEGKKKSLCLCLLPFHQNTKDYIIVTKVIERSRRIGMSTVAYQKHRGHLIACSNLESLQLTFVFFLSVYFLWSWSFS